MDEDADVDVDVDEHACVCVCLHMYMPACDNVPVCLDAADIRCKRRR